MSEYDDFDSVFREVIGLTERHISGFGPDLKRPITRPPDRNPLPFSPRPTPGEGYSRDEGIIGGFRMAGGSA